MRTRVLFFSFLFLAFEIQAAAQTGVFNEPPQYFVASNVAAIAVGDFNGDGNLDLAVANGCTESTCGNGSPGVISILLGNGDGTFKAAVNYSVGNDPVSIAVADFNGDGKLDLAVVSYWSNSLSILLGNGDGTFQSPVQYTTGSGPKSVAVGDFTGNGNADLAVANNGSNSVSVFLNSGTGTFPTRTDFATGQLPTAVTTGDFNGDGKLDLAVATQCGPVGCSGEQGSSVSVLLGNGNGTFQTQVNYSVSILPVSITAADLTGNGILDLVVASSGEPYDSGTVTILWGAGNGTFTDTEVSCGNQPTFVVVGTFSGGSQADLAVTNEADETVCVFLNAGNKSFSQPTVLYASGGFSVAAAAGDFNGDGKLDLAVTCGPAVCILLGNGSGGFPNTSLSYPTGSGADFVAIGDLNGDKKNDIVVTNLNDNDISVFLGSGGGIFQSPVTYATGTEPTSVAIGDLRNDGNQDLVVTNYSANTVSVLLNNGNGTFQTHVDYATADGPSVVVIGDVNGDGKPDLVVACPGAGSVSILLGNGDGTFQAQSDIGVGFGPSGLVLADFTGGGSLDIAAVDGGADSIVILLNNGTGVFSSVAPVLLPNIQGNGGYSALAAADFNGDGKLDLAVTGFSPYGPPGITVALGNGDGTFQKPVSYPGVGGTSIAVADFNGDGIPDVATGAFYGVDLFIGKGDGTFLPHVVYPTGHSQVSSALATGDLTGNGTADLAVVNGATLGNGTDAVASNTVTILLNAGQVATPDFSVSAPSSLSPSTISPGQSATATVTLGSIGGFSDMVTVTCSVSPTPALAPTCAFSPQQVQMKSGGQGTSTLTISTTGSTAALWSPSLRRDLLPIYAALVPAFGIVLVGFGLGAGGRRKKLAGAILCTVLLGSVAFQAACGGGSSSNTGPSVTPAGNYTVSVTASSGTTQHTASLTLTVQ